MCVFHEIKCVLVLTTNKNSNAMRVQTNIKLKEKQILDQIRGTLNGEKQP